MIEKLLIPMHPVLPAADAATSAAGGARMRVTESDLDMYAAIVGRAPSPSERALALEPASHEGEFLTDGGMSGYQQALRIGSIRQVRSWSPAMLSGLLGGISVRVRHPHISAWVKRLSLHAKRTLSETHARMTAAQAK